MTSVFITAACLFQVPNSALIIYGCVASHPKLNGFKPQFIMSHGFMG